MRDFFKSKAFFMVVSFVTAIIIWIYVVYEVNPTYETVISDVKLKCTGVSALFNDGSLSVVGENANLLSGTYTLDVRIKGKRSTVSSVSDKNFNCVLDMTTVTKNGEYNLKPSVDCDISGIEIIKTSPYNIKLRVEEVKQKDIEIKVEKIGSEKDGYTMSEPECKNKSVKITGTNSEIGKVDGAKVILDLDAIDVDDTEYSCPIIFTDSNGNEVDSFGFEKTVEYAKLTFDFYTRQKVKVILVPKFKEQISKNDNGKSVKLTIISESEKTAPDGGIEIEVELDGPVTALEKYEQTNRTVYTEDIDVSGVYEDSIFEKVKAVDLPNNVKYVEIPVVSVKAEVEK